MKTLRCGFNRLGRKLGLFFGLRASGPIEVFWGRDKHAKKLHPGRSFCAKPTCPALPKPHPILAKGELKYPKTWVLLCESLEVYGPSVAVVDSSHRLLADVSVEWGRSAEENWTFRRTFLPRPEPVSGRTLVLASTGGNTYFHWMTDVLPRIQIAREGGLTLGDFNHILVNGIHTPFQKETLAQLKIPLEICLPLPRHEKAFRLNKAVLPSLPGLPGVVPKETVKFLRGLFPASQKSSRKRIFVGRKGAHHRHFIEEGRIFRHLKKKGFVYVECEKLSVREQAKTFFSAEIVVAAHGAALTNLVFCRPGTKVIELFGPRYVNPCYRELCAAAGLEYLAVIGNGRDWGVSLRHDRPSAPITASWELLEQALHRLSC